MASDEDGGGNVGEEKEWGSVADPGCISRNPEPDFYPFRIPYLGSRVSDPGSKNMNKS